MKLVRVEDREVVDRTGEEIHHLWVLGPRGAVSTWFSGGAVRELLGHSICGSRSVHAPRPAGLDGEHEHWPCVFLEGHCWWSVGSALEGMTMVAPYDAGEAEVVWAWLERGYDQLLAAVPSAATVAADAEPDAT